MMFMADDLTAIDRLGKVFFDSYFVVDRERRIQSFNEGFVQLLVLEVMVSGFHVDVRVVG